jgi:tetratricopeptide (TPR) repeat protein
MYRFVSFAPLTMFYIILLLLVYLVLSLFIEIGITYFLVVEVAIILFSVLNALIYDPVNKSEFESRLIGNTFSGLGKKAKLFRRGCDFLHFGELSDALDTFNKLKNTNLTQREKAVLSFFLGKCYDVMGYPTNAVNYYRESLESDIGLDEVYLITARAFTVNGDFTEAEEVYDALLSKESKLENIYTDLGMVYIKANQPDKALATFSKSLKLHHNYSFALGGCALAYLLKSDTENAKFFFSQAIINNIDDIDGFTEYYCSVAESKGLSDEIGVKPHPKLYFDPALLKGDVEH